MERVTAYNPLLDGMQQLLRAPPAAADRIVNMRWDPQGAWETCGGLGKLFFVDQNNPFVVDQVSSVRTMHWFSQHNGGRQWHVWEQQYTTTLGFSFDLVAFNGSTQDYDVVSGGRRYIEAPWQGTQYAANSGWLYFINGYDQPSRWNGERVERVGFDRPAAPPRVIGPETLRGASRNAAALQNKDEIFDTVPFSLVPTTGDPAFSSAPWQNYDEFENWELAQGLGPAAPNVDLATFRPGDHEKPRQVAWRYGYCVTYVNDLFQESPPSEVVIVSGKNIGRNVDIAHASTNAGKRYALVELPDAPEGVVAIRLYRTPNVEDVADGTDLRLAMQLHTEIEAGIGTRILDHKPDRELTTALEVDKLGPFPRGAKYIRMFKSRMFLGGVPAYPDRLFFSAPLFIEQFPEANAIPIGHQDAGEITALFPSRDVLVVFKRRGTYVVTDQGDGPTCTTISEDIGCTSPNAILTVPGRGVLFVNEQGVYILEGAETADIGLQIRHIGAPIEREWREKVGVSSLITAVACRYTRDHEIWIQVPTWGSYLPAIGFVYHYNIDKWSIREGFPISCMVETGDHRGYLFVGSSDPTHPGVFVYSPGFTDLDGTAYTSEWRSAWLDFENPFERKGVVDVLAWLFGFGAAVTLNWRADYADAFALTVADSQATQAAEELGGARERPAWGTALWGSGLWSDYAPTGFKWSVGTTMDDLHPNGFQFQFRLTASHMKLASTGLAMQAKEIQQQPWEGDS